MSPTSRHRRRAGFALLALTGTLALASGGALAQNPLRVVGSDLLAACVTEGGQRQQRGAAPDSLLTTCRDALVADGYLELAVDSLVARGDTLVAYAHQGPRYGVGAWASVANPSEELGLVRLDTLAVPGAVADLAAAPEPYLDELARAGYPFARVRYGDLRADSAARLGGTVSTWSGPRVVYGGVRFVEGTEAPITAGYLERYLRLEPGRRYREADLLQVERRLLGLSFLTVRRPPTIVFENGEAYLYVDAAPRQASRFDFLLGFLPNSSTGEAPGESRLLLTGDLTLELENALRRGERLYFSFERLRPEVTEVDIEAAYPYLLDSPFGARGLFGLYRQADEWLRVRYELGVSYALGGGSAYELYYDGAQAQALGVDSVVVERARATQRLPDVLDARRNGFGLRLRLDRRDDAFETRRGWRLVADGSAALRTVTVPGPLRELGEALQRQADSLGGQTGQYRASLDVERYFASGQRATAVLRLRGALITGQQRPLRNELYRIGGNRLLRGFDEQSIDAQAYAVATAEYRLLIGGGGYLFAFADEGVLRDPYRVGGPRDVATGFGAGLRLATRAGALSLTYAYGRRRDVPIDWQRAKIHIGYDSRF